jgi:hypothetical protein
MSTRIRQVELGIFIFVPIGDTETMHRTHTMMVAGTGLWMAFAWIACGGAQDGPEEPDGQVAANPANTAGTWGGVKPQVYPTAASTPYVPPPVAPPPPPSEEQCRANASRVAVGYDTSGVTDVKAQFGRFFDAHHDTFRCCVDALEAPTRPNVNLKVSLVVRVDPAGKLTGVEFAQGTDTLYPATSKCLTDIAGMIRYPAPIGGNPVAYNRVFDFKARR